MFFAVSRIIITTLSIYKKSNFIAFAIKIETIFILYIYKHTSYNVVLGLYVALPVHTVHAFD